jgi:DNA mismatch repair ATPase MutL
MVREIDEFWQDVNVSPTKLEIDYENLNGIAIYVVLKAALPLLLIGIILNCCKIFI